MKDQTQNPLGSFVTCNICNKTEVRLFFSQDTDWLSQNGCHLDASPVNNSDSESGNAHAEKQ